METDENKARSVRALTEYARDNFARVGNRYQPISRIEIDRNGLPGTTEYEGRALAFTFEENGRSYRVCVEEITLDDE